MNKVVGVNMKYDLHCAFDIQKHKETYVNYLEVIILPTGKVEYAVPSHQDKLIHVGMKKHECSRQKYMDMCPEEYYFDYMNWLCQDTGCIAVWNDRICGKPNRFQKKKLQELKYAGLYGGDCN